jgi:hypothetical protein
LQKNLPIIEGVWWNRSGGWAAEKDAFSSPARTAFASRFSIRSANKFNNVQLCLGQGLPTARRGLNRRQRKEGARLLLVRSSKNIFRSVTRRKKGARQEQGLRRLSLSLHKRTKTTCVGEVGWLYTETDFASVSLFDCAKKKRKLVWVLNPSY